MSKRLDSFTLLDSCGKDSKHQRRSYHSCRRAKSSTGSNVHSKLIGRVVTYIYSLCVQQSSRAWSSCSPQSEPSCNSELYTLSPALSRQLRLHLTLAMPMRDRTAQPWHAPQARPLHRTHSGHQVPLSHGQGMERADLIFSSRSHLCPLGVRRGGGVMASPVSPNQSLHRGSGRLRTVALFPAELANSSKVTLEP